MPLENAQSHDRQTAAYNPDPQRRLGLVLPSFREGLLELVALRRRDTLDDIAFTGIVANYVDAYLRLILVGHSAADRTVVELEASAMSSGRPDPLQDPLVQRDGR